MKNILFWKWFDLIGQLVMALPVVFIVSPFSAHNAILAYFSVGTWQGLSCAIWAANKGAVCSTARRPISILFSIILGVFVGCMVVGSAKRIPDDIANILSGIAAIEAIAMLFLGPVLAVAYATITLDEIHKIKGALKHRSELQWRQV